LHLEDHVANQALSGVAFDLYEICKSGGLLPSFLYDGVVIRTLSNPLTGDPIKIDLDVSSEVLGLPALSVDFTQPLIKCGWARRYICEGDYDSAITYAQQACNEAIAYLDSSDTTQTKYTQSSINYMLDYIREFIELAACTKHALKTFKTMSGATFAMAPALIRAALKVKTAVPQSPVSGMFIVLLPWLYSPIVFVILNCFFQLVGNWQLLVGIIVYSFFPMLFFVIGMKKKVTRPFNDQEASKFVKIFKAVQYSKVVIGGSFIVWGLFVFAFEENENYFREYKEKLVGEIWGIQLVEFMSMTAAK